MGVAVSEKLTLGRVEPVREEEGHAVTLRVRVVQAEAEGHALPLRERVVQGEAEEDAEYEAHVAAPS